MHLVRSDEEIPEMVMEKSRIKVKVGLKPTSKFLIEMTIQSLFDQRALIKKLISIVQGEFTLEHLVTNCQIHNTLKYFQNKVDHLVP